MVTPSPEWNATTYHRVANPHVSWGEQVLARLPLRGDETVADAGCGTGRLTAELLARVPRGHVIAVDGSVNMLEVAAGHLRPKYGDRVSFLHADLRELALPAPVEAIFSTATFHWILDHPALFRRLFANLKRGGRLVAQCGGAGNLAALLTEVAALQASAAFAPFYAGWREVWEFADAGTAADRLRAAGFVEVETGLVEAPTSFRNASEYRDFLETVVLRAHLEPLPTPDLRASFLNALVDASARSARPYSLDYWRLNLSGRRPESDV